MMAGYNDTDAKSATTTLISPGFKGSEHPKECLSFWYTIGVSTFVTYYHLLMYYNLCLHDLLIHW